MKKLILHIILLIFIQTSAQGQLTNTGDFKIYPGTLITSFGDLTNNGKLTVDNGATLTNNGVLTNTGSGTITNTGTFVYNGSSTLVYSGSAQQTIGAELPNSNTPATVIINNTNGVVMNSDATFNNLTF